MSQTLKDLWHDPVWSKVIAGIILAAGSVVGTYFLNWWPAIGEALAYIYQCLMARSSLPNWGLLILGLTSIPSLLLFGIMSWQLICPQKSQSISWRSYMSDLYFNLRWRWKYFDDGQIYDVHTFCPHCDFQVYAQDRSSFHAIDHIEFHCESCNRNLAEFEESFKSIENKTKRFIQQKIRNGTWVNQIGT